MLGWNGGCPGARGLFFLLQRALETPPFLGLDKSGDKELFLVEFSTAVLKTSQAWSFAD